MALVFRRRSRRGEPSRLAERTEMKRSSNGGINSLVGQGSRFEGVARVEGTLRVDGSWEGSLEVGDTLVIGKTGDFTGDIRARNVVVCGRVSGMITASESVELQRGCRFEGDVQTRTFVVEDGVFFQGNCRMSDDEVVLAERMASVEEELAAPVPPPFSPR
jgi:cytoskeletal protein CcmA (bactofilin family)